MRQPVEDDETDDARDEVDDADGQQQPHPRPDGPQVRLVDRVEVLQALDGKLDVDVADPRVGHTQADDQQRDDRLHQRVCQVHVLHFLHVSQVHCFLS